MVLHLVGALAVIALIVLSALPARAQSTDPQAEREQLAQRRAELALEVDTLKANQSDALVALESVRANTALHQARAEEEAVAFASAQEQLGQARQQLADSEAALAQRRSEFQTAAVAAYVRPEIDRTNLWTATPLESQTREVLARVAVRSTASGIDELKAASTRLERARAAAEAAERAATDRATSARKRADELDQATALQAQLVNDLALRLDERLTESLMVSDRDAVLAGEIHDREASIAAALAAATAAAGSSERQRTTPTATNTSDTRRPTVVATVAVGGIEVATEISGQLAGLINAAAKDGIVLEGGGYRSSEEQIAIRREVCGTSDYAIWEMPSWECSPPVARPGRSMHEKGLAVDFTADGDLVRSRSHPVFRWLDANAERFGFFNLPSEPWHWSTTGS